MPIVPLSQSEIQFIIQGCNQGVRNDGRDLDDFRSLSIENKIFPHVNGSSRVKIGDKIDVLCSIKLDVTTPDPLYPDQGRSEVSVSFSPSAILGYDEKEVTHNQTKVAEAIQRSFVSCEHFPWKDLCILPGKSCWLLYVDLLIIQFDGIPLDACSIATYVALNSLVVPQTLLSSDEAGNYEGFEVVSEMSEARVLDFSKLPLTLGVAKIGKNFVLDTTQEEQESSSIILSISMNKFEELSSLSVLQGGTFQYDEIKIFLDKFFSVIFKLFYYLDNYETNLLKNNFKEDVNEEEPEKRLGLLA